MKKTIHFLFVIATFLLVSYHAEAGVNSLPAATPSIEKSTINVKGSTLPLVILVNDEYGNPVVGAEVSAACTGLPPEYTDAYGEVIFKIPGECHCSNSPVYVYTSTCSQRVLATCGNTYNVICQD